MFLFDDSAVKKNFWPLISYSPFLPSKVVHEIGSLTEDEFVYWHIQFPVPLSFVTSYFLPSSLFFSWQMWLGFETATPSKHCLSYKTAGLWGVLCAPEGDDTSNLELLPAQAGRWGHSPHVTHSMPASTPNVLSHLRCEHLLKPIHTVAARHQHQKAGSN